MKISMLFFALFLMLTVSSCKKIEGPGGSSTIEGIIYIIKKNGAGATISEYYAEKEDVYIVYGDDGVSYDDDVKTSYDGSFKFTGLEEGNYTLFVYEDCTSCASGKEALLYPVEIKKKKSTIDLGTITIVK